MSDRIEQTIHIDAEPGVVFEALTTPELLRHWLCHEAEVEPRPAGKYDLKWRSSDGSASVLYEGSAEIVDYSPGKRLSFQIAASDGPGPDSVVEFRLQSANGATDLELTQTGFPEDVSGQQRHDAYARGWLACLSALRSLLEDEPGSRVVPALMHRDLRLPGQDPCGIAWDGSSLWLSDSGRGRIFRLEPHGGQVLASFAFEGEPSGLAWDGECLWQGEREDRVVVKIGGNGKVLKRMQAQDISGELTGVAWDGQYLWLGDGGETEGKLLKIHPRSGIVYAKLDAPPGVSGLAWDGAMLWVADFEARTLSRIDPTTGEVRARVAVKGHPTGLTWDGERLWYADSEWKLASRILDPLI